MHLRQRYFKGSRIKWSWLSMMTPTVQDFYFNFKRNTKDLPMSYLVFSYLELLIHLFRTFWPLINIYFILAFIACLAPIKCLVLYKTCREDGTSMFTPILTSQMSVGGVKMLVLLPSWVYLALQFPLPGLKGSRQVYISFLPIRYLLAAEDS